MQGAKAIIRAEFDQDAGSVSAVMSGSNLDLSFLLGQIARDMAKSWARVKNIPEELVMIKVLNAITMAAGYESDNGVKLDQSYEHREDEGIGYDK